MLSASSTDDEELEGEWLNWFAYILWWASGEDALGCCTLRAVSQSKIPTGGGAGGRTGGRDVGRRRVPARVEGVYALVVEAAGRRGGRGVGALLLLGGDDGLELGALPPLLAPICGGGDLLRLVDGRLLDVGRAVHHRVSPRRLGWPVREGCSAGGVEGAGAGAGAGCDQPECERRAGLIGRCALRGRLDVYEQKPGSARRRRRGNASCTWIASSARLLGQSRAVHPWHAWMMMAGSLSQPAAPNVQVDNSRSRRSRTAAMRRQDSLTLLARNAHCNFWCCMRSMTAMPPQWL